MQQQMMQLLNYSKSTLYLKSQATFQNNLDIESTSFQ